MRERPGASRLWPAIGLTLHAVAPTPATASTEVDVYGRINLTLQNSDEAVGEEVELRNNSSRVGVKGEKALSAGLKAIYRLEFGVNIDGESDEDTFTHRNQFVGLEGVSDKTKAKILWDNCARLYNLGGS